MNYSTVKIIGLFILLILLILFSYLGFRAMKKNASQRDIDAFWICNIAFLGLLALFIFLFITPFLALAPLFPLVLFTRIFIDSRKKNDKQ